MKAVKDNKVYTIATEAEAKAYQAQGYDILNDDGSVKEYGAGKTVPIGDYKNLETRNGEHTAENKKLKAEISKLKKGEEK